MLAVLPPPDKGTKNMATKSIPKDVKAKVIDIIESFNRDVLIEGAMKAGLEAYQ
jgi:hypothetical protein